MPNRSKSNESESGVKSKPVEKRKSTSRRDRWDRRVTPHPRHSRAAVRSADHHRFGRLIEPRFSPPKNRRWPWSLHPATIAFLTANHSLTIRPWRPTPQSSARHDPLPRRPDAGAAFIGILYSQPFPFRLDLMAWIPWFTTWGWGLMLNKRERRSSVREGWRKWSSVCFLLFVRMWGTRNLVSIFLGLFMTTCQEIIGWSNKSKRSGTSSPLYWYLSFFPLFSTSKLFLYHLGIIIN